MGHAPLPNQLDSTATIKVTHSPLAECRVTAVIQLIEADPARNFTEEQLSEKVGISVSQLRADFKKCEGVPLEHYRKQKSLALAHHLIATEYLTVTKAMKRTGFNNKSLFNQEFRKAYSINPGKFREQCLLSKLAQSL